MYWLAPDRSALRSAGVQGLGEGALDGPVVALFGTGTGLPRDYGNMPQWASGILQYWATAPIYTVAWSSNARRSEAPPNRAYLDGQVDLDGRRLRALGDAEETLTFSQLVADHLEFVWRSLRRFGVREADVDDAAQQVFLVVNDKLTQIKPGQERPFLIGVAMRVASHARRGYLRWEAAEQRLHADPEGPAPSHPDPEELTQRRQARELLDRVLDAMPDTLRTVFVLFEFEDLSVDQISSLLEIPRGTAATRLRRSREVFHQHAKRIKAETLRLGGEP